MSPISTSAFHCVECLLADAGETEHDLQLGAVAFLEGGEAQLARVAGEHHPAGDADDVTGGRIGRQLGIGGANLRQGVGARDFDGIGIAALGGQALAFVPAYPELLGECLGRRRSRPASLKEPPREFAALSVPS